MANKFQPPELPKQYPATDVANHEVLLSFNGDRDALSFRDWWAEQGEAIFEGWCKDQPEDDPF